MAEVEAVDWTFAEPETDLTVHPDLEVMADPRFHPPPPPACSGDHEVGEATMPADGTPVGSIFAPGTDSFVGRSPAGSGRPVHDPGGGTPAGTGVDPSPEFADGQSGETLRVQAHFWDDPNTAPIWGMARVTIASLTDSTTRTYPFWTLAGGFRPQFKCYADDDQPLQHRFYFDWEIPVTPGIVAEPGFGVRFEVLAYDGLELRSADVNTVHVGPPPTGIGEVVPASLGVAMDEGVIVDTNNTPDDLESVLRAEVQPLIDDAYRGLAGFELPINNSAGVRKGNFTIKTVSGTPAIDLSLEPTTTSSQTVPADPVVACLSPIVGSNVCLVVPIPGHTEPSGPDDDEHRLHVRASIDDALFTGIVERSPVGADWELGFDLELELSVGIDIAAGGSAPEADVRLEDLSIDVTHEHIDIWQWLWDLLANEEALTEDLLVPVLENHGGAIGHALFEGQLGQDLVDTLNAVVADELTSLDGFLGDGVAVGSGGFGFQPLRWLPTCAPLGCDGFGAGDVLLWAEGMDVLAETGVTNLGSDRFEQVYDPETGSVASAVHQRTTDTGGHFDIGAIIDATLLNQALSALGSSGILDAQANLQGTQVDLTPEVAPIFVPSQQLGLSDPGDPPLMLFLPNLQVELSGGARFSVDLAAGVDATVDAATGDLLPSAVVALNISLLECPGFAIVCGLLSDAALLDAFESFVASEVVAPLLDNTLGRIAIPQLLQVQLGSAHVAQLDGNVAVYADVVPSPRASVSIEPNYQTPGAGGPFGTELVDVTFEVSPSFFPGSGNYSVSWTVSDAQGTVVYASPPGGESATSVTLAAAQLNPQGNGIELSAQANVAVTVQRAGASASDSASQWFWWLDPDGPCPPMC
ncbi:MAG: hypothetical protein R2716_11820 [Microthrixaceae bacterium]